MNESCLFCRIASGEIPADVVFQDDQVTAFRDIEPKATTHILIIPNQHIESLDAAPDVDQALLARLLTVPAELARSEGIAESGYRVIANTGEDAGQTVFHLHLHLLGGNRLTAGLG